LRGVGHVWSMARTTRCSTGHSLAPFKLRPLPAMRPPAKAESTSWWHQSRRNFKLCAAHARGIVTARSARTISYRPPVEPAVLHRLRDRSVPDRSPRVSDLAFIDYAITFAGWPIQRGRLHRSSRCPEGSLCTLGLIALAMRDNLSSLAVSFVSAVDPRASGGKNSSSSKTSCLGCHWRCNRGDNHRLCMGRMGNGRDIPEYRRGGRAIGGRDSVCTPLRCQG
jgi:hypothetical protein